jgi:hypothetical protein
MIKINNLVSLQWDAFSGAITQSGISSLIVNQSIGNLPVPKLRQVISICVKGIYKSSYVEIDPSNKDIQIRFYLNLDGTGNGIAANDMVIVPAGCMSWICFN